MIRPSDDVPDTVRFSAGTRKSGRVSRVESIIDRDLFPPPDCARTDDKAPSPDIRDGLKGRMSSGTSARARYRLNRPSLFRPVTRANIGYRQLTHIGPPPQPKSYHRNGLEFGRKRSIDSRIRQYHEFWNFLQRQAFFPGNGGVYF